MVTNSLFAISYTLNFKHRIFLYLAINKWLCRGLPLRSLALSHVDGSISGK